MEVVGTIFCKKTFKRKLPVNVTLQDVVYFQPLQEYTCPPLTIYRFKRVNLLPDGTLFQRFTPLDISFPFYKKRLKHHNSKGILGIRLLWKKNKMRPRNSFLVIHDPWTHNYYHWITQALPRLLLAQQTYEFFELLLPEDHQTDFHQASLNVLNIRSWRILKRTRQFFDVKNLIYPTHDVQIGDYNDELIRTLAQKLSVGLVTSKPERKIFIRRREQNKRKILNEDEVINVFQSHGFEVVEFEGISFNEQRTLLSSVSVLAGVHGAGLTNMIFMPSGSSVFELTSQINGEHYYYYSLSNALCHRYYYQVCPAKEGSVVQEANLIVDTEILEANILSILSHQ